MTFNRLRMFLVVPVFVVSLFAVLPAAHAQDPLGTVRASPIACVTGGISGGFCEQLAVSCPAISNYTAYTKTIFPPRTVPVVGTILMVDGGLSTLLPETYKYGPEAINGLAGAGVIVVELTYGSPFSRAKGWQTEVEGAGVRAASCRYATIANWVYANPVLTLPGTPFMVTGNSDGGVQIGEALAHYGLGPIIAFAELTSGPPFGSLVDACENIAPAAQAPCSLVRQGMGVMPATAAKYIDPAYPGPYCSSSYATKSTTYQSIFLHDGIVDAPDSLLDYPTTRLNFAVGQKDTSTAPRQAQLYYGKVSPPAGFVCIAGGEHEIFDTAGGANQVVNDVLAFLQSAGYIAPM